MLNMFKVQIESFFELAHEFVALRDKINKSTGAFWSLFRRADFKDLYNKSSILVC